jgi:hypothetical protein
MKPKRVSHVKLLFLRINFRVKSNFNYFKVENRCAIKIQSAWRGYKTRQLLNNRKHKVIKYENLLGCVDLFRKKLVI